MERYMERFMKRFMKIYKKVIMISVLCFTMGIIMFLADRNVMTTYAYTEEEKAAAKAWLSQNGYPPTMDGAQQAYQDYLDGKLGPVDGNEIPEGSEPQTPDETNPETGETTPPASQERDSAAETKTEENNGGSGSESNREGNAAGSDSETKTEGKEGDTGSETKAVMQKDGSGSETKEVTQNGASDSETKDTTQKSSSGSEMKGSTQKEGSGSRTMKEEKNGSPDSKTKAASQKEASDVEATVGKSSLETKLSGNMSTETESDGLLASGDGKNENPEDSAINSVIAAGDLNTVKHGKINVILIIVVIGAIVLIYPIRHFYLDNKKEKCQKQ